MLPLAQDLLFLAIQTNETGTSNNDQFTLPLNSSYNYNFNVSCRDGTIETYTSNSDITHTYPASGNYQVEITENEPGGFPAIYFNFEGDRSKALKELKQWGSGTWSSFQKAFTVVIECRSLRQMVNLRERMMLQISILPGRNAD